MEIYVLIYWEVYFVLIVGQYQVVMGINILNKVWNGVDVDGVWQVVGEFYDNCDIGMVVFIGQGEGVVDVDDDFVYFGQQVVCDQVVSELFVCFYWFNGMGVGRVNVDFKDIEYVDYMYFCVVGKCVVVKWCGGRC